MKQEMDAYAITDIGRKRTLNQDYAYLSLSEVGILPNLFVVADGMGGHRGGGYASRLAVETILEEIRKGGEESPSQVAATCLEKALEVANVGDSRLYVVNEKEIRQITQDHSLVEEMVRFGGLSREQARRHPDRNIITRAVGAEDDLKVDCFFVPLQEGDKVLLCSDGLTSMLEDEEIRRILESGEDTETCAQALVEAANNHGGRDNIAVIIIEPFSDEVSR